MIAVVVEHDRGVLAPASGEALTAAATLGDITAVVCGAGHAAAIVDDLAGFGVHDVVGLDHELLDDYGPEAWGQAVADWAADESPDALVACGTDRGNEVLAQAAARLDAPFVANLTSFDGLIDGAELVRVQWGGSLLERVTLEADLPIASVARHAVEAAPAAAPTSPTVETVAVELDAALARTVVRDRSSQSEGITLSTAPVVVGGGRGVGSPEGFEPLEELADLLGGRVGCSRAVTNNGWRNHKDQVGQTGTVVAPDVYIACGISGAIQHWVGMMNSKHILAINTDKEAPMVTKATWAVVGDLHEVVPAITAELKRRRG